MYIGKLNSKGQGLMEAIVAIGVVITGMVGAIALINFTLKSSTTSLNRLIALNLSWEAIEVAVNIRDSNFLAGLPFDADLDGSGDQSAILTFDEPANVWFVDFGPNSLTEESTRFYRQGGLYTQSTTTPPGTPTQFRRLVIIDNSIADQLRLVSTVQWMERGNTKQVSNERVLYNWRAAAPPAPPPGPPPPAGCGDGVVVAPEFCDDGDFTDAGPCNADCSAFTYCGDGTVQNPNGGTDIETCDDGGTVSGDGCSASCQTEAAVPVCGDGNIDAGEQCEPPNTPTCDATCQIVAPFCGDGNVDAGEQCEPPNTPTCDAACQSISVCGNGIVESGEECDLASDPDWCTNQCEFTCGYTDLRVMGGQCVYDSNVEFSSGAYTKRWQEAVDFCTSRGAHLPTLNELNTSCSSLPRTDLWRWTANDGSPTWNAIGWKTINNGVNDCAGTPYTQDWHKINSSLWFYCFKSIP